MKSLSARAHITLGLVSLVTSALFLASFLELIPDRDAAVRQGRLALAETVSASGSAFVSAGDLSAVGAMLKFVAKRTTTVEEINAAIRAAAEGKLKGILGFTLEPNVSIDFNHNPNSSTFHMDQTKVIEGTLVRILTWYDNEWGFSNRMSDTAVAMGKLL